MAPASRTDRRLRRGAVAGAAILITTHDAFSYFGAAYGMEFISPEGVSTDAQPSASDMAKIIAQIRKQKIPH